MIVLVVEAFLRCSCCHPSTLVFQALLLPWSLKCIASLDRDFLATVHQQLLSFLLNCSKC